jgi:hypothetical protein
VQRGEEEEACALAMTEEEEKAWVGIRGIG